MSQVIIQDILPLTQIIASGGQTVFNTTWTADEASDIIVYQRHAGVPASDEYQQLDPSLFNVTFIGDSQTVRVTLVNAATINDIITIRRDTPANRLNLYTNSNFVPSMLNQDFGILTLVDQQAQLVNFQVAPHYNYSETFTSTAPNPPDCDIILPQLPAGYCWVKNSNNTAIEALPFTGGGGGGSGNVNPGLMNQLAWYNADGDTVSGLPTQDSSAMTTDLNGAPTWVGPLTNGQIIIGSTGASPVASTLTAGTGISITNSAGGITIASTASTTDKVPTMQVFSTAGSGTYTLPTLPTPLYIVVESVGAGGGGASAIGGMAQVSAGGAGGGGGYAKKTISTPASTYAYTVGAGGIAGGGGGADGGDGGSTSFSILAVATGGSGGVYAAAASSSANGIGGAGGIGTAGDLIFSGNAGTDTAIGNTVGGGYVLSGGIGGSSLYAGGGHDNGLSPGAGAGGAAVSGPGTNNGHAGADGMIIVTEFYQ